MRIWGKSDIGKVRGENQDAWRIRDDFPSGHTACVVCDGMGGPAGGRVASGIAVEEYLSGLEKSLRPDMDPADIQKASADAVSRANQAIRAAAERNRDYDHMGTTLVSAISCREGVVITNIGDSRAYYVAPDGILRVTRDHSLVQNMVDRGDITPEEARRHPKRNLITRALGPDEIARCDGYFAAMKPGSYLLLCTDGLTNIVGDQEILFEVLHNGGPENCLERLIEIARRRGAPDNVTAVLLEWPDDGGI